MIIKTAILGYGRSGSTLHADPIEKSADFQLVAVCDIDEQARKKAFQRFGCKLYENHLDMLAGEDLDLVVVVTRSDQHAAMACDCLKAGKNVLVTKPWAADYAQAGAMMKQARSSGKMLLPWLPARWGCDLLRLKALLASGIIGRVFQVRRSEYAFGLRNDWQIWKKYAGGYLLNWGPHLVDQPIQLLEASIKTVYGEMRQINNPGDVEDVFYAVMKTTDDILIVSEYNIAAGATPNWMIQGDRGTIYVHQDQITIHQAAFAPPDRDGYRSPVQMETTCETVSGNRYGDQFAIYQHIARALQGLEPYQVTPASAAGLTRILDAVRTSSEQGKVIHLS